MGGGHGTDGRRRVIRPRRREGEREMKMDGSLIVLVIQLFGVPSGTIVAFGTPVVAVLILAVWSVSRRRARNTGIRRRDDVG